MQIQKNNVDALRGSFAGQVASFGVVQLIIRLRGLIALPILTRLIGAEGYGNIAPLGAIGGIAQTLIILGTANSLKVFIPGAPEKQRARDFWGVFQTTLMLGSLVGLLLAALYPIFLGFLLAPGTSFVMYVVAILAIPIGAVQSILYAQIVNNREGRAYSRIIAISAVLELVFLVVGAYWLREIGVLYATALAQLVLSLLMARRILVKDRFVRLNREALVGLSQYYTYGMTLVIAGLASWVVGSSDRFFLVRLTGTKQAGIYHVIYSFSSQLNHLGAPVFSALMPFVATSINSGKEGQAKKYLEQAYHFLLSVLVPAIILYSVTSRDLLNMVATREFAKEYAIVPYLALSFGLWQLVGVYNYNIHAHKRGQLMIISMVMAGIVNVGLNAIFIPNYGIMAASISTLVAYLIIFVMNRYFSNQSLRLTHDNIFLAKIAIASGALLLAALSVQSILPNQGSLLRFLATSSFAGGIYLITVFLLRAYSVKEIKQIRNVLVAVFSIRREKNYDDDGSGIS